MSVPANSRRAEVLDSAAALFESRGIRASLKDIADAAGILQGSLYYHFDSKESIVVELVQRFVDELNALAESERSNPSGHPPLAHIEAFACSIAECAVRHRAAVLLTMHEPPSSFGIDLSAVAPRRSVRIVETMDALFDRAFDARLLNPGLDRLALADWMCQSMLHCAVGVYHRTPAGRRVPSTKCRLLMDGMLASRFDPVNSSTLDASAPRAEADAAMARWPLEQDENQSRAGQVRQAARAEFARRGFDATTMRDIAAAAGVSPKAVYRVVESKDELLNEIIGDYARVVTDGWAAICTTDGSVVEKLDALMWLDINILQRYREESAVQSSMLPFAPPTTAQLGYSFPTQLRLLKHVLSAGFRSGELRKVDGTIEMQSRCAFSLLWVPEHLVTNLGPSGSLDLARRTVLGGATQPETRRALAT